MCDLQRGLSARAGESLQDEGRPELGTGKRILCYHYTHRVLNIHRCWAYSNPLGLQYPL